MVYHNIYRTNVCTNVDQVYNSHSFGLTHGFCYTINMVHFDIFDFELGSIVNKKGSFDPGRLIEDSDI